MTRPGQQHHHRKQMVLSNGRQKCAPITCNFYDIYLIFTLFFKNDRYYLYFSSHESANGLHACIPAMVRMMVIVDYSYLYIWLDVVHSRISIVCFISTYRYAVRGLASRSMMRCDFTDRLSMLHLFCNVCCVCVCMQCVHCDRNKVFAWAMTNMAIVIGERTLGVILEIYLN